MSLTSYRSWVTGELVTAAMMNQQIRDNGNAIWVGTTAGDMDYYTGATNKARLGIGTAGQVLKVNAGATAPVWGSSGGVVKRQGGSATNWYVYGTTNYIPTSSKIQVGVARFAFSNIGSVSVTITFPEAFAYTPIVFMAPTTLQSGSYGGHAPGMSINNPSTTAVVLILTFDSAQTCTLDCGWMAIGD